MPLRGRGVPWGRDVSAGAKPPGMERKFIALKNQKLGMYLALGLCIGGLIGTTASITLLRGTALAAGAPGLGVVLGALIADLVWSAKYKRK